MVDICEHLYMIDYSSTAVRYVCVRCGHTTGGLKW
jgi:hypothetical protein